MSKGIVTRVKIPKLIYVALVLAVIFAGIVMIMRLKEQHAAWEDVETWTGTIKATAAWNAVETGRAPSKHLHLLPQISPSPQPLERNDGARWIDLRNGDGDVFVWL